MKTLADNSYLVPPKNIAFPGGGGGEEAFRRLGDRSFKFFVDYGKLKPNAKVLEVGCGVGCMALPLTRYLSDKGEYHGFDLVKERIEWCQKAYKEKHPNFHFQVSDVYNKSYNPEGRHSASEYKFPYPDNQFDFVILNSVFTHMLFTDLQNYLSEISRVLKTGGKCFITYFLLNQDSLTGVILNQSQFKFRFKFEHALAIDKNVPERAIGFYEDIIREQYQKFKLKIDNIYYGSWCGRKDFVDGQDIIVATKV